MSISDKIARAKADYDEVLLAGTQKGETEFYNEFWDDFQNFGEKRDYAYAFANSGWSDVTFKPKYDIILEGEANSLFRYTRITDFVQRIQEQGIILDTSKATSLEQLFQYSETKTVGVIDATGTTSGSTGSLRNSFGRCDNLETIEKLIVKEDLIFTASFAYCPKLKNLTIEGTIGQNGFDVQYSKSLSKASWQSIVSHLSDTKTGLSITGSLDSVNKAFETSDGANDGSSSAEWLNLIATKQNWTINLV